MKKIYEQLQQEIINIATRYEVDIIKILDKLSEDNIDTNRSETINKIYDCLKEIYKLILNFIKENYPKAKVNNRIDLKVLIWNEDGLTLEERIIGHYNEYYDRIKGNKKLIPIAKRALSFALVKIVDTESFQVANGLLNEKLKNTAKYFENLNGDSCGGCNEETGYGIRPIKYLDDVPPYHPECRCIVIYYEE